MFTGIVEELAHIEKINDKSNFLEISILSEISNEINIGGEAVALNCW